MAQTSHIFLCLCLVICVKDVSSLGGGSLSETLEQLSIAQQNGNLDEILQNVTSRIVSQMLQNARLQLQKFITEQQNATGNTVDALVPTFQSRFRETAQRQLQTLLSERGNRSSVVGRVLQNLTSSLVSQFENNLRNRLPGLLANLTAGNGFQDRLQNLSTVVLSQLTDILRAQLQDFMSGNLNGGIDEIIRNLTSSLSNQFRDSVENQLQVLVFEFVNDTLPTFLAQILIPPEDASIVSKLLSSEEFEELIRKLFVGIVTDAQNVTGTGLLEAVATNGNLTDIKRMLVDALLNVARENGMEFLQNLLGSLLNGKDTQAFVQQLLQNIAKESQSDTGNDMLTALLSMVGETAGVSETIQDIFPNTTIFPNVIAEALVDQLAGNQVNLLEQLAGFNVSEFLAIFSGGNMSSSTAAVVEFLQNSSVVQGSVGVLAGLVESTARSALKTNGVGEACQDGFQTMIEGLLSQEEWALKMLDAAGKIPSDVLGTVGAWKFEGSYDECVGIRATSFKGKYCRTLVHITGLPSVPGQNAPITFGYCVPDVCKTHDISGMLETAEGFLGNVTLPFNLETECEDERRLETDAIVAICILVILAFFMVIGTLYDALVIQLGFCKSDYRPQFPDGVLNQGYIITDGVTIEKMQSIDSMPSKVAVEMVQEHSAGAMTNTNDIEETSGKGEMDTKAVFAGGSGGDSENKTEMPKLVKISEIQAPRQTGVLEQILLSFSVYTNGVKILNTEQGAGALGALNGIRFLSMAWVILGHTYYFAIGYSRNLLSHFSTKMNQWTFMSIAYGTVSVDSFFAISGILVAYLTLKELKKVKGARHFNWMLFYFHRFWRLTPPYMLVIMVGTVLLPYITSGPLWEYGEDLPFMENCRETWWTNLLYVNSLVKSKDICMGWSWYLSNDMQFYIVSPLILLPLYYHAVAGIGSCLLFLAATTTTAVVITYKHAYYVQQFLPYAPQPKDADELINLYIPSYNRMGPYIIGLFTGYLLYRWRGRCQIPKIANIVMWLLSLGILCAVVYGPYSDGDDHVVTRKESAVFEGLHRTGWGVAVCWIVFSCACGSGGWINQVLSWKAFVPLGRLTYCAYLIHPLVMSVFLNSRRHPSYFTDYEVVYMFLGHIVLSYGMAFIVSLAFEAPMMGLEKAFIRKKK